MEETKKKKTGFWEFANSHPIVTFVLGEEIIRAVVCIAVGICSSKGKEEK